MPYFGLGEIAALITAASWAGSCQVHTMIGRRIGAVALTAARIPLFLAAMGTVCLIMGVDTSWSPGALTLLAVSALAGFAISDPLLYTAAVMIGPRLALLVQSLSACLTAILGYFFLGETVGLLGAAGIVTASFGVAFVLMEGGFKGADTSGCSPRQFRQGVTLAFIAALALAAGFLLLKQALLLGIQPTWAAFLRIGFGGIFIWSGSLLRGKLLEFLRSAWTSWSIVRLMILGCSVSTVGNFLAPYAMQLTQTGIAATLIGLQPVLIIFLTSFVDRKPPTARAIIGTLIAFSGTAMIFLR